MPDTDGVRKRLRARQAVLDAERARITTALAVLDEMAEASAQRRLPDTLRTAQSMRTPRATTTAPSYGHQSRAVLAALADAGRPLSQAELRAAVPSLTSVTTLVTRGLLTRRRGAGKGGNRYTLTAAGRARLAGRAAAAPPSSGTLRKTALSTFIVRTMQEQPRTAPALVEALHGVGHHVTNGHGVTGALGSLTKRGLLKRQADGTYHVRPKGAAFLTSANGATADAVEG